MEWHAIRDPNDPELDRLAERYRLHPLHIEDCRHRNQSAKIEENHNYIFAVFKPAQVLEDGSLEVSDLDVFAGPDFVITVEETEWPAVRAILDRIQPGDRADQLFYRIADAQIDSYLPALDYYGDLVDTLEDEVLVAPTPAALARIFDAKRSLAALRRILVNTRDVAGHLQRSESPIIGRDMWPFLRDVYDHVARNLDTVEVLRDLLNGTLDVYLSSVANRTNQVMKVLTVAGTLALPSLVVSGIYGMNLEGLPWADSPYGGPIVVAAIVGLTGLLGYLLRRHNWF
jgi:magnesium transporter